eukprot:832443-Prorocentrum_minimum.AAC.3
MARWIEGWDIGRTAFHKPHVNQTILDNEKTWLKRKKGDPKLRVLVPLCGASSYSLRGDAQATGLLPPGNGHAVPQTLNPRPLNPNSPKP